MEPRFLLSSVSSTPSRYISNSVLFVEPPIITTSVQCDGCINQSLQV
jgi:hypothetical protein